MRLELVLQNLREIGVFEAWIKGGDPMLHLSECSVHNRPGHQTTAQAKCDVTQQYDACICIYDEKKIA